MAELITVARPYAEAVFRLAKDEQRLAPWGEVLANLAAMVSHPELGDFVTNPVHTAEEVEKLLAELLGEKADAQVKNLLSALSENRRLTLLPEIAGQFELLRKQEEGVLDALVTSAYPLTEPQSAELAETLKAKYGKQVKLTVKVDLALIGGITVKIGDDVIDASVRGKLHAMAVSLKS